MSDPTLQLAAAFRRTQVEALVDRIAADLCERTGTELTIPQFDELSKELMNRIRDLLEDLLRGVPSHSHHSLDAATEAGPGDGREQKAGLSHTPIQKGSS